MSDSDPSGAPPAGRLRNFFGLGRKPLPVAGAEPSLNGSESAPQVMRVRVAEFERRRVADVMIPRAEIKAVDADTELPELLSYFADVTHSRLPVYRETLDEPLGFVHIKDVVGELAKGGVPASRPLERLRRDLLYVAPSMKLADLLVKMQSSRIHIALVVDEYGGTDGLLTLEDLVEVIVGDIEDEHDDDEPLYVRCSARVWEADPRTAIRDFATETGLDLSLAGSDSGIDTLGDIAAALAGKVPLRGELLRHPGGIEIEVIEADKRRIRRLRVRLPEPSAPATSEE